MALNQKTTSNTKGSDERSISFENIPWVSIRPSIERKNKMKISSLILSVALIGLSPQAFADTNVYVPMGSKGTVLKIDAISNKIVGSIYGLDETHGLAGVFGRYLIAGSYSEYDKKENGSVLQITKPSGVSQDEHAAHHAKDPTSKPPKGSMVSMVSVIDAVNQQVIRKILVPGAVHHVEVTGDERFAVVTHPNNDSVSLINLKTFKVTATIKTGSTPNYAVSSKDGKLVFVSNSSENTVSVIDIDRRSVTEKITVQESPEHMALSPDGMTLYVANADSGTVSVIPLKTQTVTNTFKLKGGLHGIDLSDDGTNLYVAGREQNKLFAIDLGSGKVNTIKTGPSPYHLAVIRGTGQLYVSSAEEDKIWVIDQKTRKTISVIPTSDRAHQMVVVHR